jgi:hypothetical protein
MPRQVTLVEPKRAWAAVKIVFPGGVSVQAGGLSGFIPSEDDDPPDWALYLDEGWRSCLIRWPARFVDWPDFALPTDERDAFDAFEEAWDRAVSGELVDIACDGGTGRTGTAVACLAMLAGVEPDDAVTWVRANYHPYAVEVPEQEALVQRFAEWVDRLSGTDQPGS